MSVIFDQLRIAEDGKMLYLDCHVNTASMFSDRYIDKVVIKTGEQVLETETSPTVADGNHIYLKQVSGNQKEIHLALQPVDMNEYYSKNDFSSDMFFVYVVCKDLSTNECIPCELSNLTYIGTTFDTHRLYQEAMGYVKELSDTCEVSEGFIDFILRFNAFKIAADTGHYQCAVDFYKQLFGGSYASHNSTTKGCGCRG